MELFVDEMSNVVRVELYDSYRTSGEHGKRQNIRLISILSNKDSLSNINNYSL